jgi:hypothetical protein
MQKAAGSGQSSQRRGVGLATRPEGTQRPVRLGRHIKVRGHAVLRAMFGDDAVIAEGTLRTVLWDLNAQMVAALRTMLWDGALRAEGKLRSVQWFEAVH